MMICCELQESGEYCGMWLSRPQARPIGEDVLRGEVPGRSLGDEMPAWKHILGGFLLGDLHGKKFLGRSPIPLKRMSMAECSFLWGMYPSMGRGILGPMAIPPREMHPWQDAPLFAGDLARCSFVCGRSGQMLVQRFLIPTENYLGLFLFLSYVMLFCFFNVQVNLGRVEHFVKAVSSHENAILRKRSQV